MGIESLIEIKCKVLDEILKDVTCYIGNWLHLHIIIHTLQSLEQ